MIPIGLVPVGALVAPRLTVATLQLAIIRLPPLALAINEHNLGGEEPV